MEQHPDRFGFSVSHTTRWVACSIMGCISTWAQCRGWLFASAQHCPCSLAAAGQGLSCSPHHLAAAAHTALVPPPLATYHPIQPPCPCIARHCSYALFITGVCTQCCLSPCVYAGARVPVRCTASTTTSLIGSPWQHRWQQACSWSTQTCTATCEYPGLVACSGQACNMPHVVKHSPPGCWVSRVLPGFIVPLLTAAVCTACCCRYGTSLAAVAQVSAAGKHCVLDIDVQGAAQVWGAVVCCPACAACSCGAPQLSWCAS